jgi:hypothetical protein
VYLADSISTNARQLASASKICRQVENLIREARPATGSAAAGRARHWPLESLKSRRRDRFWSGEPTGFRQNWRTLLKPKSGEPPETERATANERWRGRARQTAPAGVRKPERGKAHGSKVRCLTTGRGWLEGRVYAQKTNLSILIGRRRCLHEF